METKDKNIPSWELIASCISGNASPEEVLEMEKWREASEENRQTYKKAEKIWQKSSNAAVAELNVNNAWKKVKDQANIEIPGKSIPLFGNASTLILRVAAVIAFGLFSWYAYTNFFSIKNIHSNNNQIRITLNDGSVVDLNRNAHLTYPSSFLGSTREVQLDGEAYFDIAKNPEKPFIIKTATAEIKVVGTSFNVLNKKNGDVEVIVKTGTVSVTAYSIKKNVMLHENEKAVFSLRRASLIKSENKNENFLSWKTKQFVFKETRLSEVYALVGKAYGVKIEVAKPDILRKKLTATYENESSEKIMQLIDKTFGLESSRTENIFSVKDTSAMN